MVINLICSPSCLSDYHQTVLLFMTDNIHVGRFYQWCGTSARRGRQRPRWERTAGTLWTSFGTSLSAEYKADISSFSSSSELYLSSITSYIDLLHHPGLPQVSSWGKLPRPNVRILAPWCVILRKTFSFMPPIAESDVFVTSCMNQVNNVGGKIQ